MEYSIPLSHPSFTGREAQALLECLDTGKISSSGHTVEVFEKAFADWLGVPHALAVQSGTAALHLALLALGVGPGQEVLLPALGFVAPANTVRYVGADPIFIDVEKDYAQLDLAAVETFLREDCERTLQGTRNRHTGKPVVALLLVHLLGHPSRLQHARALADRFDLWLIEDVAQSLGAMSDGQLAGTVGDIACFSFNGNKILTTAGGGMVVTRSPELWRRCHYLATQACDDPLLGLHGEVGYNYRLPALSAALGIAQLEQLEAALDRRRTIATRYAEEWKFPLSVFAVGQAAWAKSTFWRYTIWWDAGAHPVAPLTLCRALQARGIETRPLWHPTPRTHAHRESFFLPLPQAIRWGERALCLPSFSGMQEAQVRAVGQAVREELLS